MVIVGYSVIGYTLSHEPSIHARPSPFRASLPYPTLDPRQRSPESSSGPTMVQVSRYHMRLDDSRTHCLVCDTTTCSGVPDGWQTSANTILLSEYDVLSAQPTSEKALQLACTDLSNPGPNQVRRTLSPAVLS